MLRQYLSLQHTLLLVSGLGFLLSLSAGATDEHRYNRSLPAQGGNLNIQWPYYDSASKVQCGTACIYLQRVGGTKNTPFNWTLLPSNWPGSSTNVSPSPLTFSLVDYAPTDELTSGGDLVIYDTDYLRKSEVVSTRVERYMHAAVLKTGDPAALVAYRVFVQNQSGNSRDYFVRFVAPKQKNHLRAAYEVGGPSGDQPVPVGDNDGLALSSAEILIDGLPVWFSADSIHRRDKVSNSYGLFHKWGEDTTDDVYILYIGRYASAATFQLNYILNASVITDAPDCGQDFYSYNPQTTYKRQCQRMSAGRAIPYASVGGAPFEIYSTSTLPVSVSLDSNITQILNSGG
jgi:hypothetical protein